MQVADSSDCNNSGGDAHEQRLFKFLKLSRRCKWILSVSWKASTCLSYGIWDKLEYLLLQPTISVTVKNSVCLFVMKASVRPLISPPHVIAPPYFPWSPSEVACDTIIRILSNNASKWDFLQQLHYNYLLFSIGQVAMLGGCGLGMDRASTGTWQQWWVPGVKWLIQHVREFRTKVRILTYYGNTVINLSNTFCSKNLPKF